MLRMKDEQFFEVKAGTEDQIGGTARKITDKVKVGKSAGAGKTRRESDGKIEQNRDGAQEKDGEFDSALGE
jgi:hypothetical protein